jgi:hypothetical protein
LLLGEIRLERPLFTLQVGSSLAAKSDNPKSPIKDESPDRVSPLPS